MRLPGPARRIGASALRSVPDAAMTRRPLALLGFLLLVANGVPGAALFLYLQYLDPSANGVPDPGRARLVTLAVFVAVIVAFVGVSGRLAVRDMRPVADWLGGDRPATDEERRAVLQAPSRTAVRSLVSWMASAVVFGVTSAALGYPPRRVALIAVAIVLAGIAASCLDALLTERVLRAVRARALQGDLPVGWRGIGVERRLILSWAFGSGVPLVGLLLAPLDQPDRTLHSFAGALALLCLAGLLSGFVIIAGAAHAVADPLASIRAALRRIEAGDLEVVVPVDDTGEVGQVQAGINRMVDGLRQRREIEDLFGRYVGTEVAAQALERGIDLSGRRTEASVVFIDLIGSTAMAATLPPEEVVRTLNAYFDAVVGAARSEGGWVNKFEGDGALCVFGPPTGADDHPARALRAARAMGRRLGEEAHRFPTLDAAIGISCGPVVAGNIGSPERFEYTVIGDPVNEAARLTDEAKSRPERIVASGAVVHRAAGEAGPWMAAGTALLRGRTEVTELHVPAPAGTALRPTSHHQPTEL